MRITFAPLEGITGYIYRNTYQEYYGGIDRYYSPFLVTRDRGIMKKKELRDILPENNSGKVNLVPQILTNRADYFIKATKQIMDMGYTKEININIGCPSGTVVAKNKGSGFLRDTDAMERFFEEIFNWRDSDESGLDISVKTRIGVNDAEEFPDIMEVYNQYPISELTIHPRTRKQMYRDTPDMNAFDYAFKVSRNPLCYNGDIRTVMDYENFAKKYNVEAVMIGRGLIANPQLVNEIKGQEKLTKEMLKQYHDRLYRDFEKIMKADKHLLFKMKEFWNYVLWNFEDENKCAKLVRKCQNLYKYNLAVEEIFGTMELK